MITRKNFVQVNFHVFCAKIDGVDYIYQRPLGLQHLGIGGGTHADKLGHPVLLIEGKIHKVEDFEEALELVNNH